MEEYVQIDFFDLPKERQEILVAQLIDIGFEGFEEQLNKLSACIPMSQFNEEKFSGLISGSQSYDRKIIIQRNWNEEWEKSFDPVIVGDFCTVRASFHAPGSGVTHDIIITPKMSFGTGHHPTTYQMIQLMKEVDFAGKSVLDFGTGTGILAILSKKLGASKVFAIDQDDWSIRNATENFQMNSCEEIIVQQSNSIEITQQVDIILANLNKHIILSHIASIEQHLNMNGVLLLSGLLNDDEDDVKKVIMNNHLTIINRTEKDNWIALRLIRE